MKISARSKLLFIGDSITDSGRGRPVGEGGGQLGTGYVSMVDNLIGCNYFGHRIVVTNMGTGGNTVRDLKKRWQTDVIDLKPDWLSIMIGINDIWRQFDSPKYPNAGVGIEEYESTLAELVQQSRPLVKGLVLMTPFYIEPNKADAMRAQADRYCAIVKKIAAATDAIFVDTQAAFDKLLESSYPAAIGWDRVHPNPVGHTAIARAFLNSIGFQW